MSVPPVRPRSFAAALLCACRGIAHATRTQHHVRAHLVLGAAVLLAGAWVGLSALELAVIAAAVGFVLAAELVNTAVERLVDLVHPDAGPIAAAVKDVAAAAVLTAVVLAVGVGVFVFGPHLGVPAALVTRGLPILLAALCVAALVASAMRRA